VPEVEAQNVPENEALRRSKELKKISYFYWL
jgi:hypothetical protein